jgi:hypothetical protein
VSIIDELKLSVFHGGNQTRMDFRDCIGGKNGKCKSVSFKGLTPTELHRLLILKVVDDIPKIFTELIVIT